MRGLNRPWIVAVSLYVGLTLLYAWPLLPSVRSVLPSDTGDPGLVTWFLWWNAHAVPLTAHWWDAPMFFPLRGAFALSETLLSVTPVTTPLQWAGASPVLAYNVAFLLSFPAAALAAHALARHLTGRHDAAIIAGLAFGFSPYRASQMPHLQMLWSCWMPLGLLALHRFIIKRRRRDLGLLAGCWLLNGLTTGYFLIYFSVLVGLWLVWFGRRWRDWAAIGVTIGLASLPLVPLLVGYRQHQRALGLSRGVGEIEAFSADLRAIWVASSHAWLPSHWTLDSRPEGELYPGATILVLAAIGVVRAWRAQPVTRRSRLRRGLASAGGLAAGVATAAWISGGWRVSLAGLDLSVTRPFKIVTVAVWLLGAALLCDRRLGDGWRRRSAFLFYVGAALTMLLLALGPTGRVFGERFMYKAPYAWLMALPGGDALRVPARFGMLVVLCLGQAAALAFSRFTRRDASPFVLAAVALAVALDGWVPTLPTAPVPASADLAGLDREAAVIELPIGDVYGDTAALLRGTQHGHPVVNGYSGYGPPHYAPVVQGLKDTDASVLAALQQFGPLIVCVDRARDADGRALAFMRLVPDATRVGETPMGMVFTLAARHPASGAADERPLPIASVAANVNPLAASAMVDGQLATRWWTSRAQVGGDQVVITLGQSATVSRVELDLGRFRDDYPRRLQVRVGPGASPAVVWESGAAGPAMLGALGDLLRMPVVIDLSVPTQGRQITLTLVAADQTAPWSIAELRVFGR
jgi:hypothetical protein